MRKDLISKLFIFTVGAAIGSAVTWKFVKAKYEQIAQEEIDSVKEVFANKLESMKPNEGEEDEDEDTSFDEGEVKEMNDIISDLGYRNYSSKKKNKKNKRKDLDDELVPYVISPDDFGETNYDTINMTYYSDNILAYDGSDEIVEDAELLIGNYALDSFGTYEEDIVHIRNEENQCDYEICRVNERYSDVAPTSDMEG